MTTQINWDETVSVLSPRDGEPKLVRLGDLVGTLSPNDLIKCSLPIEWVNTLKFDIKTAHLSLVLVHLKNNTGYLVLKSQDFDRSDLVQT